MEKNKNWPSFDSEGYTMEEILDYADPSLRLRDVIYVEYTLNDEVCHTAFRGYFVYLNWQDFMKEKYGNKFDVTYVKNANTLLRWLVEGVEKLK